MNPRNFFAELKRRNVYKVAIAYAVVAWLLVQAASILFPTFDAPPWFMKVLVIAIVIGLPLTLILSWAFEITPEGIKRDEDILPNDSVRRKTGRNVVAMTALLAALAAGLFVFQYLHPRAAVTSTVAPASAATNAGTQKSLAVLPFVNMSSDKEQEYFSDGLSEELLNQLAQLPQLRVIARTSSFSFKGKDADVATIANALNVANVLEGSVRKSGNTLRITAQLVRASDSSHLWSQTYERQITDVFQVQDEIAGEVVAALKVTLLPSQQLTNLQHTSNGEAYEQVLLGMEAAKRGGYDGYGSALSAYQRAVDLDPQYANAYVGLANAQAFAANFSISPALRAAAVKQAFVTVDKAIALAPDLAAGYAMRGNLRHRLSWDWKGAQADFKQALALDPNNVQASIDYARALFFSGHQSEAFAMDRKATTLDPLSPDAWTGLGWHYAFAGQFAEARGALQRSLELFERAQWPNFLMGYIDLKEGNTAGALTYFNRAPDALSKTGETMVEHTRGHERQSQQLLAELKEKYAVGFAYQIAQACAWRGDKDGAFEWLGHAYDQHDAGLSRMRYDPILASLHDDPRFAELVKKMGFGE